MGWFLALLAALGLMFGGRMLQQQRIQQQQVATEQRAVDRQPGQFESRTRAIIERYRDVLDETDTRTLDILLFSAINQDAIEDLVVTLPLNVSFGTRTIGFRQNLTDELDGFERLMQHRQRQRRDLIIQQIRVAS